MADHEQPGFLYVVSWEVCNRVGGIHTGSPADAGQGIPDANVQRC